MKNEFNPAKDAADQVKHGVSLAAAAELGWDGRRCLPGVTRELTVAKRE